MRLRWLGTLVLIGCAACTGGDERSGTAARTVRAAVAANFTDAHQRLAAEFETRTGIHVVTSFGSTGQLFAQISQGAPFDIFLSADTARPAALEASGAAIAGSRFTYSVGRLVLAGAVDTTRSLVDQLRDPGYQKLAITTAATAPFGAAAEQTIDALGVRAAVAARLIRGENITQTYQFVRSGGAELGLVALPQPLATGTAFLLVPDSLHEPIVQQAVQLTAAADSAAAAEFLRFLRSPEARALIESAGYLLPPPDDPR